MEYIRSIFTQRKSQNESVFVGFAMEGFPTLSATVDVLLALERGGADIIELAVPHSDPIADGPTIQKVCSLSLGNGASVATALDSLKRARGAGLKAAVVLFGYYNTFRAYGIDKFCEDARACGADAVLCVDLPFEDLGAFSLPTIPLVAPTTQTARLAEIASRPNTPFIYAVAVVGVTGARDRVDEELPAFMRTVQSVTHAQADVVPVVAGFGISSRSTFQQVASLVDGVVVASAMLDRMLKVPADQAASIAQQFSSELTARTQSLGFPPRAQAPGPVMVAHPRAGGRGPGWYGSFGGAFIPETLRYAVEELTTAFEEARADPRFWAEVRSFDSYVGRPTPLHLCPNLTQKMQGAQIWLKREDLNHTGAHKINNALGQALLALRLGKKKIIAETGAGQHGVAVATACARLGLSCTIYMGAVDVERQSLNVFRMRALGATVHGVESGTRTLKDAVNEAMRAWVANLRDTHYILGSALGPHPFPLIVREFQAVIGKETRSQFAALNGGALPSAVVACVGGGSNAIGMFHPFIEDAGVRMLGVEAAGKGLDTLSHCAPLSLGTPGVLHGTLSMLMQDTGGQVAETHSISAGLDYPGVGPEHAFLRETGRADYVACSDAEALEGFDLLCLNEGIIPALESAHAVFKGIKLAQSLPTTSHVVICLSGRGDKDIPQLATLRNNNNNNNNSNNK